MFYLFCFSFDFDLKLDSEIPYSKNDCELTYLNYWEGLVILQAE